MFNPFLGLDLGFNQQMLCTAFYFLAHCVAQTFFPVDEVMFEFNKVRKNEVMFTLTSQLINAEANVRLDIEIHDGEMVYFTLLGIFSLKNPNPRW